MKRILVVAPGCFPVNTAECIVNIKLLRALTESGKFEIDLISRKASWENYPSDTIESYGVRCSNLKIVEVDNKINLKTLWYLFMSLISFGIFFKGSHWAYAALKEAKKLVRQNEYDYVLTKSDASYLVGSYLQKNNGIKWVASWNDPAPYEKYPIPYGYGAYYNNYITKRKVSIMRTANVHCFPSRRLHLYMDQYLLLRKEQKILIIPHIIYPEPLDEEKIVSKELKLLHAGNLKNPRSPRTVIAGLKKALDINPDMNISLSILGLMSKEDEAYAQELGVANHIHYLPPVEYKKSLDLAKKYTISVIIEADCEEGIFLPTKVGDSMQSNLVTMAISPIDGNLHDLYKEGYVKYFANIKSSDSVCSELIKIYSEFTKGNINRVVNLKKEYLPDYIVSQYLSI